MIHKPLRYLIALMLSATLAALAIVATFRIIDGPIERDIARMEAEITEAWSAFKADQAAQLAEYLESTKPITEYKGRLFVEGMVIEGGELTYYCSCAVCNGENEGVAADGTVLDSNTPPIAGANWLPLQSIVEVYGTRYRIADWGTEGGELENMGRLDIYVPEGHQAALDKGRARGVEIVIVSLGGVA